jgi:hypothetical protein
LLNLSMNAGHNVNIAWIIEQPTRIKNNHTKDYQRLQYVNLLQN